MSRPPLISAQAMERVTAIICCLALTGCVAQATRDATLAVDSVLMSTANLLGAKVPKAEAGPPPNLNRLDKYYGHYRKVEFTIDNEQNQTVYAFNESRRGRYYHGRGTAILFGEFCSAASITSASPPYHGNFSIRCPNGYELTGTSKVLGGGKGARGSGVDSLGQQITYRVLGRETNDTSYLAFSKAVDQAKPKTSNQPKTAEVVRQRSVDRPEAVMPVVEIDDGPTLIRCDFPEGYIEASKAECKIMGGQISTRV